NKEFYIVTNSMPEMVAELNDAPIKMGPDGDPILFSDVGEVRDSSQIQTNKVRVNGRTLVYVPVYRQPGSNTIEIVDRIHGKLAEILDRLKDERKLADGSDDPIMKNLTLNVVMDQSVKVRESINGLWIAGALGAVFAGIVVFIGLRNLRSTFIVVLTIPIAILTSLIGLYFTGNTINAMTLGGLALAVGILIDQAIVVIDNIERHLRMGKERMQAAWEGAREVAGPLFVSTLTFIVVFFPVIFLSGLAKFLFTPLALSVLFAVVASYLMAIFFVPVAASKLLKKSRVESPESRDGTRPAQDSGLIQAYRSLLMTVLRWKWVVLAVSLVLFIGSLGLMSRTGRELFPPIDSGQFTIYVRAASGTNIDVMEQHILKIENVLAEVVGDPAPDNPDMTYPSTLELYDRNNGGNNNGRMDEDEVTRAQQDSNCRTLISNIGVLMDWPAAYTPNTGAMDAFMLVELAGKGNKSVFDYVTELREKLNAEFPEIEFAFDTGGILTAALNMGEPSPIHLQVTGYTLKTAHKIADQLVETIKQIPGAIDVRIAQRIDYPMIRVEIDRIAAADRGVTTEEVMKCLVSSTNSSINFDPAFWIDPRNGNHYFLGTQYFEENINSLDTLKYIPVKANEDGTMTYLQDVASIDTNQTGPNVINHRNITRVTDIFANVEPGYDLGSVVAAIEEKIADPNNPLQLSRMADSRSAVAEYPLWIQNVLSAIGLNQPTKYAIGGEGFKGFTLDLHGEIRSMRDSFVDFSLGLVLSTFLVYLVMVAQFRSFLDPVIVMVAVPLGFIGVALILWLTGTRLSIQSFMGIIMMIGIVVEYTIVLMDFANHRLAEGAVGLIIVVHALADQIHRLHDLEHAYVKAVPAVAQDGAAGHGRIVVVARIMAVALADDFKSISVVHLRVEFFAVAA
ncbi:MAG: efflux RND transporter permease subunit, partial [Planctomycetes bacterium]|nr:efflux RND transporter permease subunit [Planctomycetota bacterium]